MGALYATLQRYRDWSGDQDTVLSERDLQRASRLIRLATEGVAYSWHSETGIPTDTAVAAAFEEATLEVLDALAAAKSAGELVGLQSASIGGVSYTLRADAVVAPDSGLPIEAHRALADAGLLRSEVWVVG